jgi:hypothetical protein
MMVLKEIGLGVMGCINLAEFRGQWRADVNTVMNFRFHKMFGNYRVAERLAASQGVS